MSTSSVAIVIPGTISNKCWMKRSICLLKQISLLEIASTAAALLAVVVESSGVFHVVGQAALQATHRCTPAPHGMPAALPTHTIVLSELLSDLLTKQIEPEQNMFTFNMWPEIPLQFVFVGEATIGMAGHVAMTHKMHMTSSLKMMVMLTQFATTS